MALQQSKSTPVILLVHDQEVTRSILQCAGVDISPCQIGIKSLLACQRPKDNLRPVRQTRRSRSRSPRRDFQDDVEHKSPIGGNRSDHSRHGYVDQAYGNREAGSYAPIYVIDVQSMYRRLMQTDGRGKDPPGKDVASTARELLLPDSPAGWCAGNECGILIDIWLSMAEGPPIDEQRALRQAAAQATNVQLPASTSNVVLPAEDSDDDRDPNNAIFNATGPSGDPYEDLEDDDDDDD